MTPQRVTLITLGVADLARSRAFYEALGWVPAQTQEGVVFYQMQGAVLALFGRDGLAADQGRPGAGLGTGGYPWYPQVRVLAPSVPGEWAEPMAQAAALAASLTRGR